MNESTHFIQDSPDLADLLQQAFEQHRSGNLFEAGSLYQTILKHQPDHAEANHKLGLVAVQAEQPEAGLPYFEAALNADPTCKIFWLSYIDALLRTSQYDEAQAVLALARQHGLEGEATDALAERIADSLPAIQVAKEQPASAVREGPGRSPKQRDMQALLTLFNQQRFKEMERDARTLTRYYPHHPFGWKMLGIALQLQGDSRAAIAPTRKAIELTPGDVENHYNLGVVFQNLEQMDNAASCYLQALVLNPSYGDAALNLGVVYHRLGKLEDAVNSLKQALRLNPNSAKAHGNLGATLQDLGRLTEAESSFRRSLAIAPGNAVANNNLGVVLQKQGLHSDAETYFRKALNAEPNYVDAHANLAISLREQDRQQDAEISMNNALRIRPDDAKMHNNLAIILQAQGRLAEADAHFQIALHINPENAEVWGNRANLLCRMSRIDEAEACYRQGLQLSPDDAGQLIGIGDIHRLMCNYGEAETYYRKALLHKPDDYHTARALGVTLNSMGQFDQAENCFRSLLSNKPDDPMILSNLGLVLQGLGRLEEASTYFMQACALAPDSASLYSNWLYCLLLCESKNMRVVFRKHFQFGERFEPLVEKYCHTRPSGRDQEKQLRVGFVSGDLFNHAVASFIEPMLGNVKKYPGFSLHAYYNNYINDAITRRLKTLFDHWSDVANLTDGQLAEKVRGDNIDILIDLSGHTAGNRLLTFAHKPAPIQASWIGYPGTTGMSAIDYYVADRNLLPPGKFDDQFTEKIVRLPATTSFQPDPHAPEINPLPALEKDHLTFGSFNRSNKLSRTVIALWARILRGLPDSVMILGGMSQASSCQHILEWFAEEGISSNRLFLHPRAGMYEYLQLYHQVDICLDTFPYNGGTTTHHALWMGVPTLTMAGPSTAGRVGAAILLQAGLDEFIAASPDEFLQRGLYWAKNLSRLAKVRAGLRDCLISSPWCDPEVLAASLTQALRQMWVRHCAGLAPESFEVQLPSRDSIIEDPKL